MKKLFAQKFFILSFLLFIYGCSGDNQFDSKYTNGDLKDNLEIGYWEYRDAESDQIYKSGKFENGYKVGNWKYFIEDSTYNVEWSIFKPEDSRYSFSTLEEWNIIEEDNYVFLASTNDYSDSYLVITKTSIDSTIRSVDNYMESVFSIMKSDTSESFTGYTIEKTEFEDGRTVYSGEIMSEKQDKHFISYVFYVKVEDHILDITRKEEQLEKTAAFDKIIFNDFVYGIFRNSEKLFYVDDFIKTKKLVNLEEL